MSLVFECVTRTETGARLHLKEPPIARDDLNNYLAEYGLTRVCTTNNEVGSFIDLSIPSEFRNEALSRLELMVFSNANTLRRFPHL